MKQMTFCELFVVGLIGKLTHHPLALPVKEGGSQALK